LPISQWWPNGSKGGRAASRGLNDGCHRSRSGSDGSFEGGDPEFRAIDAKSGDHGAALGVHAKELGGAEGGLVEVAGLSPAAG
jgi:hypothetical protein